MVLLPPAIFILLIDTM